MDFARDTGPLFFVRFQEPLRVRPMGSDPINALSQLKAEDVETVEFYRGPSQLPMEAVGDACAAIFITTRFTTGSVLTNK